MPLLRYACLVGLMVHAGGQAEIRRRGGRILFEPRAIVYHYNRPGFRNLLGRNYRWGYSAIESKAPTGAARLAAGAVRWMRFGPAAAEARPRWE
jgi:hypothetical protein